MYGLKYIISFTNDLGEFYEIYFSFLNYSGAGSAGITAINLTGTQDVLTIRSTGGDETKLSYILGTEALINIAVGVNDDIDISDLIAQHDNDIQITIYKDNVYTTAFYQGFVVVEDNSQPFQDRPFTLSIRALDGLGLLKGVDLTDTTGFLFNGNFSIVEWLAQILYKTGQTLNLKTYFNFYNAAFNKFADPLTQIFLSSTTFSQGDAFNAQQSDPSIDEASIAADDCYTALEKIVRCLRCRLFQEDGCWHLVNFYEYFNPNGYTHTEYSFDDVADGIVQIHPVAREVNKTYATTVGKDEIIHPVTDDAILYLKLATKWVKLTYNYDQSQNKVCNQDLTDISPVDRDPTFDETISSSVIDSTITPVVNLITQGYDAFCWTVSGGSIVFGNVQPYPATPASSAAFIRNVLNALDSTLQTFLVVKNPGANKITYFKTSQFLIDAGDVLQVSFSWRTRAAATANQQWLVAFINFYGDDGSFYGMECQADASDPAVPTIWEKTDANFNKGTGGPTISTAIVPDTTQWTNVGANTSAQPNIPYATVPVSGRVEIILCYQNVGGLDAPVEMWFKDLTVTILPFLNGAYNQKISGDYNFSGSNNDIKQTDAEIVEISDSPKRYFKGALIDVSGDLLSPIPPGGGWSRSGVTESLRFTAAMERIMYNNLYRIVQKIEGTMRGLTYHDNADFSKVRPTGYLNTYRFVDSATPDKKYILTSFEKSIDSGQGRHVFIETSKDMNDTGFVAPDKYVFDYIFSNNG